MNKNGNDEGQPQWIALLLRRFMENPLFSQLFHNTYGLEDFITEILAGVLRSDPALLDSFVNKVLGIKGRDFIVETQRIYGDLTVTGTETSITGETTTIGNNGTTQVGTLNWTDADLEMSGDFVMNGTTNISGASAVFNIGDDVTVNNNANGSSNGNLAWADASLTCDDIVINGTTTLTTATAIWNATKVASGGDLTVSNNGTTTNGSLSVTDADINCSDDFLINGAVTISGASSLISVDDVAIGNNTITNFDLGNYITIQSINNIPRIDAFGIVEIYKTVGKA